MFGYYAGGAADERTLRENRAAFARLLIRPRCLVDVARIDTRTAVLQQRIAFPVLLAPVALQCMAHLDGEKAAARAALASSTVMTLSTTSTTSIEDVRSAAPSALLFFQLSDRASPPTAQTMAVSLSPPP